MNKAAFLNIVRQVAPIQDQEVDDLEKLVVSFPYCQTAHVLLAKAAHDRGSMLSTQKLRRAAAHASNRQVLKQVVYALPTQLPVVNLNPEEAAVASALEEPTLGQVSEKEPLQAISHLQESNVPELEEITDTELPGPTEAPEITSPPVEDMPALEEEPDDLVPETDGNQTPSPEIASANEEMPKVLSEEEEMVSGENSEASALTQVMEDPITEATVSEEAQETEAEEPGFEKEEELPAGVLEEDDDFNLDELLDLIQINGLSSLSVPIPRVDLTHEEIISELTSSDPTPYKELILPLIEEGLPVSTQPKEDVSAYLEIAELYTVYDTSGYEFPTFKANPTDTQQPVPEDTDQDPYLSIFTQNNLAYWMGSSRLGESIQLKNELTSQTPFYFQPELILEHVKEATAPAPPAPETPAAKLDKQLLIIDQFLKASPKRKTLANAQLSQEPQEDLSAKSSKIKKTLVSENLALIFQKQGKARKAIKIYEQLIVKFPEKKSYFAEQIENLRNEL